RAVGVQPGDEVVTTAWSFVATAEAIVRVGATPVFVDIDPHSLALSPDAVRDALTPRTRAIVPVHLFGWPADMHALRAIANSADVALVDDAAQAMGARLRGQRVGTLADATAFSFFPTKPLGGLGDGGMVTT